ncbi:hypothetical protein [uncultured Roseovarius sp.]|uniref:hypothetical protein n=1 Tax=uncultured Roseovarius sp. TaxID=293344 RepID=UPI00260B8FDF|nr:hypothetical protein [uncultured Roseovarius sp.]
MNDKTARELIDAINVQVDVQEEANGLIRSLISALNATAQELQDLSKQLKNSKR